MQVAHTLTRLLLSFGTVSAFADPGTIAAELVNKIAWAALACEGIVLLSILARRRWLLIVVAAVAAVFAGSLLGAYVRVLFETTLGRLSAFVWQLAFDSAALMSVKYLFVGVAVGWADRLAASSLKHYLAAGVVAAFCAAAITWTTIAADPVTKLGTVAIDFVFPIGCSTVVYKVRQFAQPLIAAHAAAKSQLRNI